MNTGGDAAEQVVRLSLEGMEVTARIAGAGAERIAAMLTQMAKAGLSGKNKTHGKQRLSRMLKSGEPLQVFTIQNSNLKIFQKEAKRYGVLYCALKLGKLDPDGITDVMVRAVDAAKINRIVERFHLQNEVTPASIQTEIHGTRGRTKKEPDKDDCERVVDELMAPGRKDRTDPNAAGTERKTAPSEKRSMSSTGDKTTTTQDPSKRPSVREALRRIQEQSRNDNKTQGRREIARTTKSRKRGKPKRLRKKTKIKVPER